jgi:hypothetical protein
MLNAYDSVYEKSNDPARQKRGKAAAFARLDNDILPLEPPMCARSTHAAYAP